MLLYQKKKLFKNTGASCMCKYEFEFLSLSNHLLPLQITHIAVNFSLLLIGKEQIIDDIPDKLKSELGDINKIPIDVKWGMILNMTASELYGGPPFTKKIELIDWLSQVMKGFRLVFGNNKKSTINSTELEKLKNFCIAFSHQIFLYQYK